MHKLTCKPALADLDTALALAFPESFPAFPPGWKCKIKLEMRIFYKNIIDIR